MKLGDDVIRQLVARGSDQLESLSSFSPCAHFTFHIYVTLMLSLCYFSYILLFPFVVNH